MVLGLLSRVQPFDRAVRTCIFERSERLQNTEEIMINNKRTRIVKDGED